MDAHLDQAVQILQNGGIVIFPTDTAFGIGCVIDNIAAIDRLFMIRQRPITQATPILVDSVEMAQRYVKSIPQDVKMQLMDRYWPGALTIVLPAILDRAPSSVRGGGENLGVRMPNHKTTLELIKRVGKPILGTSANFHGQPTPFTFDSLDKNLVRLADGVIEGECTLKQESTVINCAVTPWQILRQGAVHVSLEAINNINKN